MSTLYTINVVNNSLLNQDFFFFQQPAIYTGGSLVYSNSLYHQMLLPSTSSGATLTFQSLQQFYAGAQTQVPQLTVGEASGYTTAIQPIDLTPATASAASPVNNSTLMTVSPALGLSPASPGPAGVQKGAFRITTQTFNSLTQQYNAGMAVKNMVTGDIVLSNFVNAEPNKNIDCQPVMIFYVAVGSYQPGSVINFSESSVTSAVCDATTGFTSFDVTYNPDGTWSVANLS